MNKIFSPRKTKQTDNLLSQGESDSDYDLTRRSPYPNEQRVSPIGASHSEGNISVGQLTDFNPAGVELSSNTSLDSFVSQQSGTSLGSRLVFGKSLSNCGFINGFMNMSRNNTTFESTTSLTCPQSPTESRRKWDRSVWPEIEQGLLRNYSVPNLCKQSEENKARYKTSGSLTADSTPRTFRKKIIEDVTNRLYPGTPNRYKTEKVFNFDVHDTKLSGFKVEIPKNTKANEKSSIPHSISDPIAISNNSLLGLHKTTKQKIDNLLASQASSWDNKTSASSYDDNMNTNISNRTVDRSNLDFLHWSDELEAFSDDSLELVCLNEENKVNHESVSGDTEFHDCDTPMSLSRDSLDGRDKWKISPLDFETEASPNPSPHPEIPPLKLSDKEGVDGSAESDGNSQLGESNKERPQSASKVYRKQIRKQVESRLAKDFSSDESDLEERTPRRLKLRRNSCPSLADKSEECKENKQSEPLSERSASVAVKTKREPLNNILHPTETPGEETVEKSKAKTNTPTSTEDLLLQSSLQLVQNLGLDPVSTDTSDLVDGIKNLLLESSKKLVEYGLSNSPKVDSLTSPVKDIPPSVPPRIESKHAGTVLDTDSASDGESPESNDSEVSWEEVEVDPPRAVYQPNRRSLYTIVECSEQSRSEAPSESDVIPTDWKESGSEPEYLSRKSKRNSSYRSAQDDPFLFNLNEPNESEAGHSTVSEDSDAPVFDEQKIPPKLNKHKDVNLVLSVANSSDSDDVIQCLEETNETDDKKCERTSLTFSDAEIDSFAKLVISNGPPPKKIPVIVRHNQQESFASETIGGKEHADNCDEDTITCLVEPTSPRRVVNHKSAEEELVFEDIDEVTVHLCLSRGFASDNHTDFYKKLEKECREDYQAVRKKEAMLKEEELQLIPTKPLESKNMVIQKRKYRETSSESEGSSSPSTSEEELELESPIKNRMNPVKLEPEHVASPKRMRIEHTPAKTAADDDSLFKKLQSWSLRDKASAEEVCCLNRNGFSKSSTTNPFRKPSTQKHDEPPEKEKAADLYKPDPFFRLASLGNPGPPKEDLPPPLQTKQEFERRHPFLVISPHGIPRDKEMPERSSPNSVEDNAVGKNFSVSGNSEDVNNTKPLINKDQIQLIRDNFNISSTVPFSPPAERLFAAGTLLNPIGGASKNVLSRKNKIAQNAIQDRISQFEIISRSSESEDDLPKQGKRNADVYTCSESPLLESKVEIMRKFFSQEKSPSEQCDTGSHCSDLLPISENSSTSGQSILRAGKLVPGYSFDQERKNNIVKALESIYGRKLNEIQSSQTKAEKSSNFRKDSDRHLHCEDSMTTFKEVANRLDIRSPAIAEIDHPKPQCVAYFEGKDLHLNCGINPKNTPQASSNFSENYEAHSSMTSKEECCQIALEPISRTDLESKNTSGPQEIAYRNEFLQNEAGLNNEGSYNSQDLGRHDNSTRIYQSIPLGISECSGSELQVSTNEVQYLEISESNKASSKFSCLRKSSSDGDLSSSSFKERPNYSRLHDPTEFIAELITNSSQPLVRATRLHCSNLEPNISELIVHGPSEFLSYDIKKEDVIPKEIVNVPPKMREGRDVLKSLQCQKPKNSPIKWKSLDNIANFLEKVEGSQLVSRDGSELSAMVLTRQAEDGDLFNQNIRKSISLDSIFYSSLPISSICTEQEFLKGNGSEHINAISLKLANKTSIRGTELSNPLNTSVYFENHSTMSAIQKVADIEKPTSGDFHIPTLLEGTTNGQKTITMDISSESADVLTTSTIMEDIRSDLSTKETKDINTLTPSSSESSDFTLSRNDTVTIQTPHLIPLGNSNQPSRSITVENETTNLDVCDNFNFNQRNDIKPMNTFSPSTSQKGDVMSISIIESLEQDFEDGDALKYNCSRDSCLQSTRRADEPNGKVSSESSTIEILGSNVCESLSSIANTYMEGMDLKLVDSRNDYRGSSMAFEIDNSIYEEQSDTTSPVVGRLCQREPTKCSNSLLQTPSGECTDFDVEQRPYREKIGSEDCLSSSNCSTAVKTETNFTQRLNPLTLVSKTSLNGSKEHNTCGSSDPKSLPCQISMSSGQGTSEAETTETFETVLDASELNTRGSGTCLCRSESLPSIRVLESTLPFFNMRLTLSMTALDFMDREVHSSLFSHKRFPRKSYSFENLNHLNMISVNFSSLPNLHERGSVDHLKPPTNSRLVRKILEDLEVKQKKIEDSSDCEKLYPPFSLIEKSVKLEELNVTNENQLTGECAGNAQENIPIDLESKTPSIAENNATALDEFECTENSMETGVTPMSELVIVQDELSDTGECLPYEDVSFPSVKSVKACDSSLNQDPMPSVELNSISRDEDRMEIFSPNDGQTDNTILITEHRSSESIPQLAIIDEKFDGNEDYIHGNIDSVALSLVSSFSSEENSMFTLGPNSTTLENEQLTIVSSNGGQIDNSIHVTEHESSNSALETIYTDSICVDKFQSENNSMNSESSSEGTQSVSSSEISLNTAETEKEISSFSVSSYDQSLGACQLEILQESVQFECLSQENHKDINACRMTSSEDCNVSILKIHSSEQETSTSSEKLTETEASSQLNSEPTVSEKPNVSEDNITVESHILQANRDQIPSNTESTIKSKDSSQQTSNQSPNDQVNLGNREIEEKYNLSERTNNDGEISKLCSYSKRILSRESSDDTETFDSSSTDTNVTVKTHELNGTSHDIPLLEIYDDHPIHSVGTQQTDNSEVHGHSQKENPSQKEPSINDEQAKMEKSMTKEHSEDLPGVSLINSNSYSTITEPKEHGNGTSEHLGSRINSTDSVHSVEFSIEHTEVLSDSHDDDIICLSSNSPVNERICSDGPKYENEQPLLKMIQNEMEDAEPEVISIENRRSPSPDTSSRLRNWDDLRRLILGLPRVPECSSPILNSEPLHKSSGKSVSWGDVREMDDDTNRDAECSRESSSTSIVEDRLNDITEAAEQLLQSIKNPTMGDEDDSLDCSIEHSEASKVEEISKSLQVTNSDVNVSTDDNYSRGAAELQYNSISSCSDRLLKVSEIVNDQQLELNRPKIPTKSILKQSCQPSKIREELKGGSPYVAVDNVDLHRDRDHYVTNNLNTVTPVDTKMYAKNIPVSTSRYPSPKIGTQLTGGRYRPYANVPPVTYKRECLEPTTILKQNQTRSTCIPYDACFVPFHNLTHTAYCWTPILRTLPHEKHLCHCVTKCHSDLGLPDTIPAHKTRQRILREKIWAVKVNRRTNNSLYSPY